MRVVVERLCYGGGWAVVDPTFLWDMVPTHRLCLGIDATLTYKKHPATRLFTGMTSFSPVFKYSCHRVSLFENNCFFKEGSDGPDLTKLRQYKYSDCNLFHSIIEPLSVLSFSIFLTTWSSPSLSLFLLSLQTLYSKIFKTFTEILRNLGYSGTIFFSSKLENVFQKSKRNRGQEISLEGYFRHSCPCPFRSGELHRRSH